MDNLNPHVRLVPAEEVGGEVAAIYGEFLNNGKAVPKWMMVMANNQDILVGFFRMFRATMDESPLPALMKWKVAQLVSKMNQCQFCVDVTEAQLRQFGLGDEQIEKLEETADERERLAMEFGRRVTEEAYKIEPGLMERVKQQFNDAELVELVAVIGLFNYINRFNDALGVLPSTE